MPIRKVASKLGLGKNGRIRYDIIDRDPISADFFEICEFPETLTAGKNVFKFRGDPDNLVNDSQVYIEILDFNGDPIYYEVLNYKEKDGVRVIAVYIYHDTPDGKCTYFIAGRAQQDPETGQRFSYSHDMNRDNFKDFPNILWVRHGRVAAGRRNNSEIIFVQNPNVTIKEDVKTFSQLDNIPTFFTMVSGSSTSTPVMSVQGTGLGGGYSTITTTITNTLYVPPGTNKFNQIASQGATTPPIQEAQFSAFTIAGAIGQSMIPVAMPSVLANSPAIAGSAGAGPGPGMPNLTPQVINNITSNVGIGGPGGTTNQALQPNLLSEELSVDSKGGSSATSVTNVQTIIFNPPDTTKIDFTGFTLTGSVHLGSTVIINFPKYNAPSDTWLDSDGRVIHISGQKVSTGGGIREIDCTYTGTIVDIENSTTARMSPPFDFNYGRDSKVDGEHAVDISAGTAVTMSYWVPSISTETENSMSFANITLSNIQPATGDIFSVKTSYKLMGAPGDYIDSGHTILELQDILIDTGSTDQNMYMGVVNKSMGKLKTQGAIDTYWSGSGPRGAKTTYDSEILNESVILESDSAFTSKDDFIKFELQPKYKRRLFADTEYALSFFAKARETGSLRPIDVVTNRDARIDVYITGSAVYDTKEYHGAVRQTPGGNAQGMSSPGQPNAVAAPYSTTEFGVHLGTVETDYNGLAQYSQIQFVPENTNDYRIIFVVRKGKWFLTNIGMNANIETGYSPNYAKMDVRIPSDAMNAPLAFKFQYLDYLGVPAMTETYIQGAIFDGDNTYLEGTGNLFTGSIYIGNAVGSGIELAGVRSAFIRAIGYEGFQSASRTDRPGGFMIWSGSVLPDAPDAYAGVGLEMLNDSSSYFRFRTDPSILDIRTDSFFLGGDDTYLSGSNGNIEITSSNFWLQPDGDVIMQGTITATAGGTIGGAEIGSSSLAYPPFWEISASNDSSDPVSFISSSAFKVSSDGRITASAGEIGGWTIFGDTIGKNTDTGVIQMNSGQSIGPAFLVYKSLDTSHLASLGTTYYENKSQGFGFSYTSDYNDVNHKPEFTVGSGSYGNQIAGWTFDNAKLYNTGVILSASYGLKVFDGTDDNQDFIELKYKAADKWGLKGVTSGNEMFHLGDHNQIASWSFDNTKIISNMGVNSPNNPGIVIKSEGTIETDPFISGLTANATGWQIRADGRAEFENAVIRGTLSTAVFEKDTISVVGGQVMIANAAKIDNVNPRFTEYPYLHTGAGERINYSGEELPATGSATSNWNDGALLTQYKSLITANEIHDSNLWFKIDREEMVDDGNPGRMRLSIDTGSHALGTDFRLTFYAHSPSEVPPKFTMYGNGLNHAYWINGAYNNAGSENLLNGLNVIQFSASAALAQDSYLYFYQPDHAYLTQTSSAHWNFASGSETPTIYNANSRSYGYGGAIGKHAIHYTGSIQNYNAWTWASGSDAMTGDSALYFKAGQDQRVNVPFRGWYHLDGYGTSAEISNFSVMAWVKPFSVTGSDPQIIYEQGGGTNGHSIYISESKAWFTMWEDVDGSGNGEAAIASCSISAGTWTNLVGVHSGSNAYIYKNGVLGYTTAYSGFTAGVGYSGMTGIGAVNNGTSVFHKDGNNQDAAHYNSADGALAYTGSIDQIAVWQHYALKQSDATNLYNYQHNTKVSGSFSIERNPWTGSYIRDIHVVAVSQSLTVDNAGGFIQGEFLVAKSTDQGPDGREGFVREYMQVHSASLGHAETPASGTYDFSGDHSIGTYTDITVTASKYYTFTGVSSTTADNVANNQYYFVVGANKQQSLTSLKNKIVEEVLDMFVTPTGSSPGALDQLYFQGVGVGTDGNAYGVQTGSTQLTLGGAIPRVKPELTVQRNMDALVTGNERGYWIDRIKDGQSVASQGAIDTGYILLNAQPTDDYTPYIDIVERQSTGVGSVSQSTKENVFGEVKTTVRIGDLSGITDYNFSDGVTGYGIYTLNGYFKGKIEVSSLEKSTAPSSDNLIGHYPLQGYALDESGSKITLDLSGNNYHTSCSLDLIDPGNFKAGVGAGPTGGALEFDGDSTVVKITQMTGSLSEDMDISIAWWQKQTGEADQTCPFHFADGNNNEFALFADHANIDGKYRFTGAGGTGAEVGIVYIQSGSLPIKNNWRHFCVTAPYGNSGSLYIDGVHRGAFTSSVVNWDPHEIDQILLGADADSNNAINDYFEGQMSEFRFYKKELSDVEVQSLFLAPNAVGGRTIIEGNRITTGKIRSNNWGPSYGSQLDLDNGTIVLGGNSNPLFEVDSSGHISASAGNIGGVTLGIDKMHLGTGYWNSSDTAFYVDDTGSFSLGDQLTWDGDSLNVKGNITVHNSESFHMPKERKYYRMAYVNSGSVNADPTAEGYSMGTFLSQSMGYVGGNFGTDHIAGDTWSAPDAVPGNTWFSVETRSMHVADIAGISSSGYDLFNFHARGYDVSGENQAQLILNLFDQGYSVFTSGNSTGTANKTGSAGTEWPMKQFNYMAYGTNESIGSHSGSVATSSYSLLNENDPILQGWGDVNGTWYDGNNASSGEAANPIERLFSEGGAATFIPLAVRDPYNYSGSLSGSWNSEIHTTTDYSNRSGAMVLAFYGTNPRGGRWVHSQSPYDWRYMWDMNPIACERILDFLLKKDLDQESYQQGITKITGNMISTGKIESTNWSTHKGSQLALNDGIFYIGGSSATRMVLDATDNTMKFYSGSVVHPLVDISAGVALDDGAAGYIGIGGAAVGDNASYPGQILWNPLGSDYAPLNWSGINLSGSRYWPTDNSVEECGIRLTDVNNYQWYYNGGSPLISAEKVETIIRPGEIRIENNTQYMNFQSMGPPYGNVFMQRPALHIIQRATSSADFQAPAFQIDNHNAESWGWAGSSAIEIYNHEADQGINIDCNHVNGKTSTFNTWGIEVDITADAAQYAANAITTGFKAKINNSFIAAYTFYGTGTTSKIYNQYNIESAADIIAYASDERLKENIFIIEDPIEKIKNLRGVYFDWKDKAIELGFNPDKKHDVGMIAQELEKVLPEAVYRAPFDHCQNELLYTSGSDVTGKAQYNRLDDETDPYKTIKMEKVVPLLIEGIKEQQKQIETLINRINKLENK